MEQQGLMPPNGMAPNMNTMQRPQPGNVQQQLYAKIMEDLRQNAGAFTGMWQATMDPRVRANAIMQLVTALRVLEQDTMKCINIAETWERRTISNVADQAAYGDQIRQKLNDIRQRREQNAGRMMQGGQMGMMANNNNNMGMQQNNMNPGMNPMQNFNMGAMNNMGMSNGQMVPNMGQQNNFQLQMPNQMMQQQQQQNSNTMNPNVLQNTQVPPQMQAMNQPNQQNVQQVQSSNNGNSGNNGGGGSQTQSNAQLQQEAMAIARKMYAAMPEQKKVELRQNFMTKIDENQRQQFAKNNSDPLIYFLLNKARQQLQQQRGTQGPQQSMGGMQAGGNNQGTANNTQATAQNQGTIDYQTFLGQQANALKLQESGEQVVPASNNNNNGNNGNASNNNNGNNMNFGAGQMNMPQGINPQMLGNQGNQTGNAPQMQNMQRLMAQQEEQKRLKLQQQHQMAQHHANLARIQQNQSQLQGQPGGLHAPNALNGGPVAQVNSPAMSMLNRPMAPPGQSTPATPAQNRPNGIPQTPASGASQLQQHHQNMINNGQNTNQPLNLGGQNQLPPAMLQILQKMPPAARSRLASLNQAQMREVLQRMAQNGMNQQGGQVNMQPGMNFNFGSQPQAPGAMPNGMQPQNMPGGIPDFNLQMNQNQPPQSTDQNAQTQLQQRQLALQQDVKRRAMDAYPFPRPLLNQLNNLNAPANLQTWGQLKMHCMQNQASLPQSVLPQLQLLQNQYFDRNPQELNSAVQRLRAMQQAGQPLQNMQAQQNGGATAAPMQNGQAPPAQMVQPNQMQQQNQGMRPGINQPQPGMPPVPPPTMQEMEMFRQRFPNASNMTDEQIKAAVMQAKFKAFQQQRLNQDPAANRQAMGAVQPGMPGAMPQKQAPPSGLDNLSMNQQQPRSTPQPGSNQALNQQGQKRPGQNEDVMEIPNPNGAQPGAARQPPTLNGLPQKFPTNEELQKMPVAQRSQWLTKMQGLRQMDSLRRASQAVQQNQISQTIQQQQPQQQQQPTAAPPITDAQNQQQMQLRLRQIVTDVKQSTHKGPAISLDGQGLEQAKKLLKMLYGPLQHIERSFPVAMAHGFSDDRLREIFRAKLIVMQNCLSANGDIRDYLAVTPETLGQLHGQVHNYFRDMKAAKDRREQQVQQQQQQQQPPQQQQPQPLPQPQQDKAKSAAPATATPQPQSTQKGATGKQQGQTQAATKATQHNRKASSAKPPAAPIEEKAPDVPWGAPSPHGVPKYSIGNDLTPDKLRFPPQKKRKGNHEPGSAASTPAAQISTPTAVGASPGIAPGKVPSPEVVRKQQQVKAEQQAEAQKEKFRCTDHTCNASVTGFDTEEDLKKHTEVVHQPIEDPFAFLMDQTAPEETKTTPTKPDVRPQMRKPPGPIRPGIKKDGQTPNIKQEGVTPAAAGTPATPSSAGKPLGKASATPSRKPAVETKAAEVATEVTVDPPTLRDLIAEKQGFTLLEQKDAKQVLPEITIDNTEGAWADAISGVIAETDGFESFIDFDAPIEIDTWGLRPDPPLSSPEMTPSNASQSSHDSDISANDRLVMNFQWDAFGDGQTFVPEVFKNLALGDAGQHASKTAGEQDSLMADAADDGETKLDSKGTQQQQQLDGGDDENAWTDQRDFTDWEAMFGPTAGLEGPSMFDDI